MLADLFAELGHHVVVAGEVSDPELGHPRLLAGFAGRPDVELLDIAGRPALDGSLSGLGELTEQVGADVTLLADADGQLPALAERLRLGGPALRGRIVGLFIRSTNYVYERRPSLASRLRRRLGAAANLPVDRATFHERLLPAHRVLDATLVLDERFVTGHATTHRWMPDIFRELDRPPAETKAETRAWATRLQAFVAANANRPVIVYVGPSQARRGYTDLLRLALAEGGCVVHCGQLGGPRGTGEVEEQPLRAALAQGGALLETQEPYLWPGTADAFFRAAPCVVLPYRQHYGSSGIMLQAVAAGRPVLVPDRGLMAWRVRTFGLGETYRDGDFADMARQFRALCARSPAVYEGRLRRYAECFSRDQVAAAIAAAVTGSGPGARLPQDATPVVAPSDDAAHAARRNANEAPE